MYILCIYIIHNIYIYIYVYIYIYIYICINRFLYSYGVFLEPTFSFHINAFRGLVNRLTPSFPKYCIEKNRKIQHVVQSTDVVMWLTMYLQMFTTF